MQNNLTLVFAGTPEFGLPSLNALASSGHLIKAVYTQPDRAVGRGRHIQYSPIKQWALAHTVPVIQPDNFKSTEALQQLADFKPDLMVVIAYGLILPKAVLTIPRLGCINVHSSLLPAWRGASPIQGALLNGDQETGVTLMQMDVGMDTGDILAAAHTLIKSTDTVVSLHDRLAQLAAPALLSVVDALAKGVAQAVPQIHAHATYTKKIDKEEAHVDWTKPAEVLAREIRAYYAWPVSFTFCGESRIRLWEASVEAMQHNERPGTILKLDSTGMWVATGREVLCVHQFQFPGGKVMQVSAWIHAKKPMLLVGQCLT